jgi:CheY-like chemotaxis protein
VAALARSEFPDAVVLDATAPELGAWRALSALQADPGTARLRTGLMARDGETMDALDLGTFHAITKPISLARVTEVIGEVVRRVEPGTVLVADDDPDVRRILTEALSAAGWHVLAVQDASEAVRQTREHIPDVAIIDLLLPGLGRGLGVLATLRLEFPEHTLPVIVLLGREVSAEEMNELDQALEAAALSGDAAIRPIARIVRDALSESPTQVPEERRTVMR